MENHIKYSYVKCSKCGWIHFEVSANYVRLWQSGWKKYWNSMTLKDKAKFDLEDGPPDLYQFLHCFKCGVSYKNFEDINENDILIGLTIQPIMTRFHTLD